MAVRATAHKGTARSSVVRRTHMHAYRHARTTNTPCRHTFVSRDEGENDTERQTHRRAIGAPETRTAGESTERRPRRAAGWLGLGGRGTLRPRRQCHTPASQHADDARQTDMHTRTHARTRALDDQSVPRRKPSAAFGNLSRAYARGRATPTARRSVARANQRPSASQARTWARVARGAAAPGRV